MEQNQVIRQILYNWVRVLPIDEFSGESIVTAEDVERLNQELSEHLESNTENRHIKWLLSKFFRIHLRNFRTRFPRQGVSLNLFNPL